jgi:hypothetical protein
LELINQANDILITLKERGYNLTLRQLYYQLVSKDIIPNNMNSYKRLGNLVNDARLAGIIGWDLIEDRTRSLNSITSWINPREILMRAVHGYRLDRWLSSDTYMEVWVEKEALIDVVKQACIPYDIPCFACRGYVSQSAMWRAAQRFIDNEDDFRSIEGYPQRLILIHLGDHDPSGIDMTRDIKDRFDMFGADVKVERIALNMNQIDQYNPPPNPAKITDSRSNSYIDQFGPSSWELDALDPDVIKGMIQEMIFEYMPMELRESRLSLESAQREKMISMINSVDFDDLEITDYNQEEDEE